MSLSDLTPIVRAGRSADEAPAPYDFEKPQTFSDRQIRRVAEAQSALAVRLAAELSKALGTFVAARCAGVAEVEAQDFDGSRNRPTGLFVATVGAAGPGVVLDLPPALVLFLIERQLGGADPFEDVRRPLSALEASMVLRDWFPRLGVAFAEAWRTVPLVAVAAGDDVARQELTPETSTVVVVSIEVELGGGETRLSIAYPADTLHLLLARGADPDPAPAPGPGRVGGLGIDVRAELGRTRLPVSDLTRLAPGDVIPLGRVPGLPIPVWIGDRLHFEARPGTRAGRLAVEVLTPPAPPTDP